jgi:hypothetical protein
MKPLRPLQEKLIKEIGMEGIHFKTLCKWYGQNRIAPCLKALRIRQIIFDQDYLRHERHFISLTEDGIEILEKLEVKSGNKL